MQVPTARHHVVELRTRHERRVTALPPADLFHCAAKQHHAIGGRKPDLRLEGELALARAELDFDRAQRQAQRDDLAAHDVENRLELIEARFGQILIALGKQTDLRRGARPRGIGRGKPRIVELEDMKLDLEAGDVVEPGLGEPL